MPPELAYGWTWATTPSAGSRPASRLLVAPDGTAYQGYDLIGTAEVAKALGISQQRVQVLVATGRIAAGKIGARLVFRVEALANYDPRPPGRPARTLSQQHRALPLSSVMMSTRLRSAIRRSGLAYRTLGELADSDVELLAARKGFGLAAVSDLCALLERAANTADPMELVDPESRPPSRAVEAPACAAARLVVEMSDDIADWCSATLADAERCPRDTIVVSRAKLELALRLLGAFVDHAALPEHQAPACAPTDVT